MILLKKVKDVAEELGVSSQTVYNHIQKLDQKLKPYLLKREGATVIDTAGVKLIRKSIYGQNDFKENLKIEKEQETVNPEMQELIKHYKSLIETLKEQLEEKDRQIERSQILQQQNQQRILELEGEVKEQKKSLWQRLKWWEQ